MSAYYPTEDSVFVTASDLPESSDERTCPFCGHDFDEDGRARAAYLRHVAECKSDFEGQATLECYGVDCPRGEATDSKVAAAIEELER